MRIWLSYCLLAIMAVVITGTPLSVAQDASQNGDPVFAWVTVDLYVQHGLDGEAQIIASGDIQAVKLSPQGTRVAFRHGPDADASLWVVDASGGEPVQIAEATYPIEIVWLDETTFFYNTADFDPNTGFELNNDLWRANVETTNVTRLSVGGQINLSPDGMHLVVIDGGIYNESPGQIWHLEPEDAESVELLYTFDAIASGRHDPFYPQVSWIDNDRVALALPVPDLLYAAPDNRPPTQLVSLDMFGDVEELGTIVTDLFAFPIWSPDGEHLLYSESDTGTNVTLWLANQDGSDARIVDELPARSVRRVQWLDAMQFVYIKGSATYVGSVTSEPYLWLEDAFFVPRIAGSYVMYMVPEFSDMMLRVALLNEDNFTQIADSVKLDYFDIVMPSSG